MPAGSQWEKRIGTVRVNAPAGGTNRCSFISTCSFDSGFRRYCPFAARLKNRGDHRAGMSNLDRTLPPARLCLVTARCPSLARPARSATSQIVEGGCHEYLSTRPVEQANVWDDCVCRFTGGFVRKNLHLVRCILPCANRSTFL